jgi:hypothetical protein
MYDPQCELKYNLNTAKEVFNIKPYHSDFSSSQSGSNSFAKVSYDDAVKLSLIGDQELLRSIETRARELSASGNGLSASNRLSRVYSDSDGDIDVSRHLSKSDTPFIAMKRQLRGKKLISLVINQTVQGGISHQALEKRGVAIYTAIRALELKGYSIEICLVCPSPSTCVTVTVKQFGEYLDPAVACFWVSHPAAFRRCMFRLIEDFPIEILQSKIGNGYGRCADQHPDTLKDNQLYIPYFRPDEEHCSVEDHLKDIITIFKNKGIVIA